jgi:hypothetical protein
MSRQHNLGTDQAAPSNQIEMQNKHIPQTERMTTHIVTYKHNDRGSVTFQIQQPFNQPMLLEPSTFDNFKY